MYLMSLYIIIIFVFVYYNKNAMLDSISQCFVQLFQK